MILAQFGFELVWAPSIWWSAVVAAMPQILTIAALMAASIGLSYLARPSPGKQRGQPIDLNSFPTIAEGTPYPVIFGTVRIDGYDAEWVGDTHVGNHYKDDIVEYRYYYSGMHFIYCQGPVDGLKQLWYGDAGGGKCAWPTVNDPTVFASDGETACVIDAGLYGGIKDGGMGHLACDNLSVLCGNLDQTQNAYLVSKLGSDIPAFRGVASLAGYVRWGGLPNPLVLAGVWKRVLIQNTGEPRWYISKAAIGTLDINPIHVLYECLTNMDWGERMSADLFGDTWTTVADTLYGESFGISYWYVPEPGNLKTFVADILNVIDGTIYDDPNTGKLEICLARDDYDIDDLPVFTRSDFEINDFAKPLWRDIPGHIIMKYTDRLYLDKKAETQYIDDAIIDKQGRPAPKVLEYPMICDATLANTVVSRKGRAMTALAAGMQLSCKRTMSGLHRGSIFKLTYDDPNLLIASMAVRVASINYGGSENQSIEMTVVEDIYKQPYTVMGVGATQFTEPTLVVDDIEVVVEVTGPMSNVDTIALSDSVTVCITPLLGTTTDSIGLADSVTATRT